MDILSDADSIVTQEKRMTNRRTVKKNNIFCINEAKFR